MITSPQNEKVKLAHALQTQAKARRRERKIALEGTRLVRDALDRKRKPEFVLYDAATADTKLINILGREIGESKVLQVSPELLQHVSVTEQPQGVVAVLPLPTPDLPREPRRVLILDGVRDPGNMGTVLRTAAAAGVQVVILSPDCVDPYNPKVLRGGMGAHFRVPIVEAPWEEIATYCEGLPIYLADGKGDHDYDAIDWARWALIIGSEGHGASKAARTLATQRIRIPMAAATESINAGVAAGVILFEAARQRRRA
ncbi:MAG: RNA methyltransferase [Chloroflexota bacterium]|nr:RNA methyltransferase [Chloroflexota bacterium]